MDIKSLCPEGLMSVMECISRAALLSQPKDIHEFLLQYFSELISFKKSQSETDPNVVSFGYQELWEKNLLRTREGTEETPVFMTETSAASPQLPSQAEIEKTLKVLYTALASCTNGKKVPIQSQKQRQGKPSGLIIASNYLTPPPGAGRKLARNGPLSSLAVKGEKATVLPPINDSVRTRRVSSLRIPIRQQSQENTVDVKKTPRLCQRTPPVIPKTTSTSNDGSNAARKPSKSPHITLKITTHEPVFPPAQKKTTRGGQVSRDRGEGLSSKSSKGLAMNREVVPEKTSSRSPVGKALKALKDKGRSKTATIPESTKEQREPEKVIMSAGHTKTKIENLEKNRIQPQGSIERIRGINLLQTDRRRVKPVQERTIEGIQGTAFGKPASIAPSPNNLNQANDHPPPYVVPHFAHPVDIIRHMHLKMSYPLRFSVPPLHPPQNIARPRNDRPTDPMLIL